MSTLRWIGFPVRLILAAGFIVLMTAVMLPLLLIWAVISPRMVSDFPKDWVGLNNTAWGWAVNPW